MSHGIYYSDRTVRTGHVVSVVCYCMWDVCSNSSDSTERIGHVRTVLFVYVDVTTHCSNTVIGLSILDMYVQCCLLSMWDRMT